MQGSGSVTPAWLPAAPQAGIWVLSPATLSSGLNSDQGGRGISVSRSHVFPGVTCEEDEETLSLVEGGGTNCTFYSKGHIRRGQF